MANLSGQNIGTNYKGILNLNTLNGNLTTTLQAVTDGDGNASPLQLSTTQVAVISSGVTQGGFLFRPWTGDVTYQAIYNSSLTPSNSNYLFLLEGSTTYINSAATLNLGVSGGYQVSLTASRLASAIDVVIGTTSASARLHVRGDGTNPSFRSENSAATQGFIHSVVGDINNLFLGRFADTSVAGNIFYDNSSGLLTISNSYTPAPNFGFINLLHGQTSVRIQNGTTPLNLLVSSSSVFSVNNVGAIAIGNTVTAAVAVPSTHKVTVVIGGVTYFLLASNV
jgi:hypothetical protein